MAPARWRPFSRLFAISLAVMLLGGPTAFAQDDVDGEPEATVNGQEQADDDAGDEAAQESAILLPATMEEDVITEHLRAGEFQEAIDVAETQFERSDGQLSLRLYQHGMGHLGLAEETGDEDHYKSAGLSFMRVLTYFSRSRFAPYAELELGYIHARIGRDDIARRLLSRVRPAIDREQDPQYHERLMTLIDELPEDLPEETD